MAGVSCLLFYLDISLAGFEVLSSKLRKLNVLDLSENHFNDDSSMLSCLTGLSSLKSLDLSDNMLTGSTGMVTIELSSFFFVLYNFSFNCLYFLSTCL